MMQGLYTSSTGMQTHSQGLGIIGNNLANTNTVGFKQQLMLFDNLQSKDLPAGAGFGLESKQVGYGSHIGYTRTLFSPGALAAADNMTDLAIGGKGFFQVTDGGETHYTRAGNFHFDQDGIMRTPSNKALSGIPIIDGVETGGLGEIDLGANNGALATDPAKATTQLSPFVNMYAKTDTFTNEEDPYFAMIQSWDGTKSPPISGSNSVGFHYYDAAGVKQNLQLHFDQASTVNGEQVYEYAVTMDPKLDGRAGYADTKSAGLLMSGTMTFSPAGELVNMNSFAPSGGDLTTPAGWSLAGLTGGLPNLAITQKGQAAQNISINLGIKGKSDAWTNKTGDPIAGITADAIGKDFTGLPGMTDPIIDNNATTALKTSSALKDLQQDGYPLGDLSILHIDNEGIVHAGYTNGQSHELYRIPIFRFTSEDGLRRDGDNLYSYTDDAGKMEHGVAGTENYGKVYSNSLEQSNVDMSREMVNMIVVQRGFQSNSKSMQTIDTMIQKAIEMKR